MDGIFDDANLKRHALMAQLDPQQAPAETPDEPERGMGKGALATLLAGQGADAVSTLLALQNPNLREGNPLMKNPAVMLGSKAGLAALMALLSKKMPRKAANVMGYVAGGIGGGAAVNNAIHMAKAKQ